jgi:hypothetical protein
VRLTCKIQALEALLVMIARTVQATNPQLEVILQNGVDMGASLIDRMPMGAARTAEESDLWAAEYRDAWDALMKQAILAGDREAWGRLLNAGRN